MQAKTTVNPIIDWSNEDVWEFLNDVAKVPHCELYDQGYERLGCIGCPLASINERRRAFELWPKYKQNYINAFQRMIDERNREGAVVLRKPPERKEYSAQRLDGSTSEYQWKNGQECFRWWMNVKE